MSAKSPRPSWESERTPPEKPRVPNPAGLAVRVANHEEKIPMPSTLPMREWTKSYQPTPKWPAQKAGNRSPVLSRLKNMLYPLSHRTLRSEPPAGTEPTFDQLDARAGTPSYYRSRLTLL